MRHLLRVNGPLDLDLTFRCGQAFRWTEENGVWSGVVGEAEARVRLDPDSIRGRAGAGRSGVRLIVDAAGNDPGADAWSHYIRLDENPNIHLRGAEALRSLPGFEPLLGLRLLRQDPWESLASFICSAAANIAKITRSVEGLAARFGDRIPGSARRAFPPADRIARARESQLRALGLGFRAPLLLETARRIRRSPLAWDALRTAPIEAARAALMEYPGVGGKVADCALLFGLGRLEAYPVDRWIRRATMELSGRPRARDRELDEWARRLGPGRGYLQQLLFHLRRTGGPLPVLPLPPA